MEDHEEKHKMRTEESEFTFVVAVNAVHVVAATHVPSQLDLQSCLSGLRSNIPLRYELTAITYHFITVSSRTNKLMLKL